MPISFILLGRGAYGIVERVIHTESQFEMALKRITAVSQEGKRFLMVNASLSFFSSF